MLKAIVTIPFFVATKYHHDQKTQNQQLHTQRLNTAGNDCDFEFDAAKKPDA